MLLSVCQHAEAQQSAIKPLLVGEHLPDVQLTTINYKFPSVALSHFQDDHSRLLLIDFWNTKCIPCIRAFAKLDSLQQLYGRELQILLVTHEDSVTVQNLLGRWGAANHKKLSVPIVINDSTLKKYIRRRYNPHYAWIAPDGTLLAQTSSSFITKDILGAYLQMMKMNINKGMYKPQKFQNP